jgi:hypothetical protein
MGKVFSILAKLFYRESSKTAASVFVKFFHESVRHAAVADGTLAL